VPGIECVPAASKISFKPRTEVQGRWIWRYPDVTQIARAIARRNVHAAATGPDWVHEIKHDGYRHSQLVAGSVAPERHRWCGHGVTLRRLPAGQKGHFCTDAIRQRAQT
jgi:hypothetical protein